MRKRILAAMILGLLAATTNAGLRGRLPATPGGTDFRAYYDDQLTITWLADANLAASHTFGVPGIDFAGVMTWETAQSWIAAMNAAHYLGVSDWRLPNITDTGAPGCDFAFTGTDCGYNVDLGTGEVAHLFYATLGNTGDFDVSGNQLGCNVSFPFCLTNTGPFSNLRSDVYWSGTEFENPTSGFAWAFFTHDGAQGRAAKAITYYAWVVHPGDIAALHPALEIRDLRSPGDGLITFDRSTSLEWLDLTETRGRSYDDISGQFGPGGDFEGWRYATLAETQTMFDDNFDPDKVVPISPAMTITAVPVIESFFGFFGIAQGGDCLGTTPPGPCPRSQGRTGTSFTAGTHEIVGFITIGGGAAGSEIRQSLSDSHASGLQFASYLVREDADADAIPDTTDNCLAVANPDQADSDGDGAGNLCDNCRLLMNNAQPGTGPAQHDTDGDGYGNLCDGDLDNSGGPESFADLALFRAAFGTSNPDADLNGSGGPVNFADLAIFRALFGSPAGPGAGP